MQRGWSHISTVVVVVVVAVLAWLVTAPVRAVSRVHDGMTRAEAIEAIGRNPDREESELSLCRKGATWYGDCDEVRKSSAVTFLLWKVVESWVVIGLDGQGKVAFRGEGEG